MRYSEGHKQQTRQRILAEAARQVRERGVDGVSVGEVMAGAGLTHGGFYAHFRNKEALLEAALRSVHSQATAGLSAALAADPPDPAALVKALRRYLSAEHRDHPGAGCVVAALGAEAPRQPAPLRDEVARRAHALADAIAPLLAEGPDAADQATPADRHGTATAVTATLVGGLILARLERDAAESDRVLRACQAFLEAALRPTPG